MAQSQKSNSFLMATSIDAPNSDKPVPEAQKNGPETVNELKETFDDADDSWGGAFGDDSNKFQASTEPQT